MQKKLVLETTAPFQGLAELVAFDEGLFAKEGLTIEWADRAGRLVGGRDEEPVRVMKAGTGTPFSRSFAASRTVW